MVKRCCVPGCSSGNSAERKRNKERKLRNPSLFGPPDFVMLQKWSEAIPITDNQMSLSMKDCVCELHFEKKYINRYYETKMADGSIFRLERGLPSLVSGAIPTIFSHSPNNILNSRTQTLCVAEPDVKEKLRRLEIREKINLENKNSTNIDADEETMEILTPLSIKEEPPFEEQNSQNICPAINAVAHSPMHPIALDNSVFNFNFLVKNLSDIDKPTSSWVISLICEVESKYVMCAMWRNYQAEKRVIIDTSLNIKVFLKDKQIVSAENEKIYCLGDIAGLLEKINYYDLCAGMDEGISDCLAFIDRRLHNFGRPCVWCSECRLKKTNVIVRRKRKIREKGP